MVTFFNLFNIIIYYNYLSKIPIKMEMVKPLQKGSLDFTAFNNQMKEYVASLQL